MLSKGSEWLRWEPHIHAPGTIKNDQFSGADAWERYLEALEQATPPLRAIGVTDYYTIDTYERVRAAKAAGRLAGCNLLFPNIEMRLSLGTVRGNWVNVHLLVNPEHPDHVGEINRLLARLEFQAFEDTFGCTRPELIRLGRRADPTKTSDAAALEHGADQYKVSFPDLMRLYRENGWVRENVLIVVAAGVDGTSGVRDGADATLREEIEKAAHAIFSGNPGDRDFWLGLKSGFAPEVIRDRFDALKPVIWGSDAHDLAHVAKPDQNRLCWIKGSPTFDTLKQACIDPLRAYVGPSPAEAGTPSQVISALQVSDTPWLRTPDIGLSSGLVAIIGARGSGKTALADMLAAGCDAFPETHNAQSFLSRANADGYLEGASVAVTWGDGNVVSRDLDDTIRPWDSFERVRYLSQQFVDDLCSSNGMTDKLLSEIERVIFAAHSVSDSDGMSSFGELRALRSNHHREAREREEEALSHISDRIASEMEKTKLVAGLRTAVEEKTKFIERYTADRARLIPKNAEATVERLSQVAAAIEHVRLHIRSISMQQAALATVQGDVSDFRRNRAPEVLRGFKDKHRQAGINEDKWPSFLLTYSGDVDTVVSEQTAEAVKLAGLWKGSAPAAAVQTDGAFVSTTADLKRTPLAPLEAEARRLEALVAADRETALKLTTISNRISQETIALQSLKERLEDCEGAKARAVALTAEREAGYLRVFDALLAEEAVLNDLYAPLMQRVSGSASSVRKLTFSVTRTADVKRWAENGEELLDKRKYPFRGLGTLLEAADTMLRPAWETGDSAAVAAAMTAFREKYQEGLLEASRVPRADQDYRAWSRRFARWLFSTDHITLHYSIDYEGVDIRRLSPGTRGIVLLLLYLALDDLDDRPLIIDQPEENLDPKSIFNELVGLFQAAKTRRQVIIVTHNANLVVNADADQVLIAQVAPQSGAGLPPITYTSGGLDEQPIRKAVCDILEGGERAFRERALRLRVKLER